MTEWHKNPIAGRALVMVSGALLSAILIYAVLQPKPAVEHEPASIEPGLSAFLLDRPVAFEREVRPILERRCVVCHGCYDAPCQLKLSSHEGLQRGASEELVYNPARISPMQPTRLFVDAKTTAEWRTRGFHPVVNEGQQSTEKNLEDSVLYRLLQLKQQHPQPESNRLPDSFTLELNREQTSDDLQLPADRRSTLNLLSIWTDYWQRQRCYMASKQALFEKFNTHDIRHAMSFIWDDDGNNPNAALTVFRHFDSGSVAYGLVGAAPETTWIIDYPLFERIHYLLVAGFNVYGNVVHQVNTRVYMDFLRMEGEDHFLVFLPAERRRAIRDA